MTFVDTGAWYATFVASDVDHPAAVRWYAAYTGQLRTTDYVIDETLTLLRSRGHEAVALQFGADVFAGKLCSIHYLTRDEIAAAWDVFQRYRDKGWSFTDCTSKVVIESLGITQAFAFDQHFRQFGSVAVAP
ncbi:MAG: PIN domain-containing protein [Gemmataceae bacterium]